MPVADGMARVEKKCVDGKGTKRLYRSSVRIEKREFNLFLTSPVARDMILEYHVL